MKQGLITAAALAFAAMVVALITAAVWAEDGGQHYSDDHWYSYKCCSREDCKPVTGVTVKHGHYVWDSWRMPGTTLSLPANDFNKVLGSQDHQFHACEGTTSSPSIGKGSVWPRCIYVPGSV